MLDKVLYRKVIVSQDKTVHELVLIFDNRPSFTLGCDSLRGVLELYDWFMVPLEASDKFVSLRDYNRAVASSQEDTQVIDIELIKKAS